MIDDSMDVTLVVDLDGTLLKSDSLWEGVIRIASARPWLVLVLPIWLLQGRAFLKKKCAPYIAQDVADWPYNANVIELIEKAKIAGRTVCLATAADGGIACAVAEYIGLFDKVFYLEGNGNLKERMKLTLLQEEFGSKCFDYMGDSAADLPIFAGCRRAYLVGHSGTSLAKKVAEVNSDLYFVSGASCSQGIGGGKKIIKAIRIHQWIKNLILFVPFILTHDFTLGSVLTVILGALIFSFCASCIYVINDLADLSHDRRHQKKKYRSFAAGEIPLWNALVLIILLMMLTVVSTWTLPISFTLTLAAYFILACLYSWYLKRIVILDVVVLSGFYVLRLIAGAMVLELAMSNCLLGYVFFFFLGLSIIKRTSEICLCKGDELSADVKRISSQKIPGRSYRREDLQVLESMAVASGFAGVTVLALYIDSMCAVEQYSHSFLLWGLCPLLIYWYGRILIIAHRGGLAGDLAEFVAKDPISLYCGGVGLALLLVAI